MPSRQTPSPARFVMPCRATTKTTAAPPRRCAIGWRPCARSGSAAAPPFPGPSGRTRRANTIAGIQAEVEALRLAPSRRTSRRGRQPSDPNHAHVAVGLPRGLAHAKRSTPSGGNTSALLDLPEEDLDGRTTPSSPGCAHVKRLGFKTGKNGKPTRSVIDRYCYPPQEIEIGRSDKLQTARRRVNVRQGSGPRPRGADPGRRKGPSRADRSPEHGVRRGRDRHRRSCKKSVMRLAERVIEAARLMGCPRSAEWNCCWATARLRSGPVRDATGTRPNRPLPFALPPTSTAPRCPSRDHPARARRTSARR